MQVRFNSKLIAAICLVAAALFSAKHLDAKDDILTTAAKNGSFNTLVNLVVAADLDDTLQSKGHFTVFAPTDEAFENLPKGTVDSLLKPKNKSKLVAILKYHVVNERVSSRDAVTSESVKTLNGSKVKISIQNGKLSVNDSTVTANDIEAENGIIHVIDQVLIP